MSAPARAAIVLALSVGCGGEAVEVAVDLETDYAPGLEFDRVITRLTRGDVVREVPFLAFPERDAGAYTGGLRVARFEDVERGPAEVQVILVPTGPERLNAYTRELQLSDNAVVTARIPRGCDVEPCARACAVDEDCSPVVGCSLPRCLAGRCEQIADDSRCPADEICRLPLLRRLTFVADGRRPERSKCVSLSEPAEPAEHGWHDNFLCWPGLESPDYFVFTTDGVSPPRYNVCVPFVEPGDPHTWADNALCSFLDLRFRWSSEGRIEGMDCLAIHEPADPEGWDDNFLCFPSDVEPVGCQPRAGR